MSTMHPLLREFCLKEKPYDLGPVLQASADLNARDDRGVSALGLLVEVNAGDWCWIGLQHLILAGADPTLPLDSTGQTLMHRAYIPNEVGFGEAPNGCSDVFCMFQDFLLTRGVAVESEDTSGQTPLAFILSKVADELTWEWSEDIESMLIHAHWLVAHGAHVTPAIGEQTHAILAMPIPKDMNYFINLPEPWQEFVEDRNSHGDDELPLARFRRKILTPIFEASLAATMPEAAPAPTRKRL